MAENTSGLSQVCSTERIRTGGNAEIVPIAPHMWSWNNLQMAPSPCPGTVTDKNTGAVCCPRTAYAKVPILVILCQGLECISAHSFKSEENCLKCCWFYLNISVTYFFLLGKHCDGVNENSSPGSTDGGSACSYTLGQKRNWFFSLPFCVGLAFVSALGGFSDKRPLLCLCIFQETTCSFLLILVGWCSCLWMPGW